MAAGGRGRETIIIRKGEEYERRIAPSDAILGLLMKRGDMLGNRLAPRYDADKVLTFEESQRGISFDGQGRKCDGAGL